MVNLTKFFTETKSTTKMYIGSLLLLVVGSTLSLTHNLLYGVTILVWIMLLLIGGVLLLIQIVEINRLSFLEWLIYAISLSLSSLMVLGLTVNTIGLAIHQPVLVPSVLVPSFFVIFFVLVLLSIVRKRAMPAFHIAVDLRSWKHNVFVCLPLLFPIVSLMGVVRLNNGGTNLFALVNLVIIAVYEIVMLIKYSTLSSSAYGLNIFCTALALVLSISMRSNFLIGIDIHNEYRVFIGTLSGGLWHPHLYNTTYNACLSITILPTVLKSFIPLSSEFIFKFLMQLFFCLVPVCVYVSSKQLFSRDSRKLAFVAALFFTVQSQFITEFPALIRQEIALLFFALLFMTAASSSLTPTAKKILTLVFGLSMVVSHYSTTYVCLALLIIFMALHYIYGLFYRQNTNSLHVSRSLWHIKPLIIAVLLLSSFLWYAETLQSTGGIAQKFEQSFTSFGSFFSSDSRSGFVVSTFHIGNLNYNTATLTKLEKQRKVSQGYSVATYAHKYTPVPLQPSGPQVNTQTKSVIYNFFNQIIPLIVKCVVVIGAVYMLYLSFIKKQLSPQAGFMVIGGGILFLLLAILPVISQDYNIERLYQQLLVVLAGAIIFGAQLIAKKTKEVFFIPLLLLVVVGYFICTSGLANQVAFHSSNVNLDNNGATYDDTYTTTSEVLGLQWLSKQYKLNPASISFDRYSILYADAYAPMIPTSALKQGTLPSEFTKWGYAYASNTNINKDITYDVSGNLVLTYNYPLKFLNYNKNTIYDSNDSRVYR
jgi:uncharacterized membrane protein